MILRRAFQKPLPLRAQRLLDLTAAAWGLAAPRPQPWSR